MKNTLLVFIRNPQLGSVKTRLARTLGDEEALHIYHLLLKKARAAALACDADRWLFYSDFLEENDDWPRSDFQKKTQHPGSLGERMEDAFQKAFEAGAVKAVIIGSDCPELTGALLQQAFDLLDTADFVLGPAHDGGYYLLGMRAPEPAVFRGMEWSTDTVLEKTLEKIRAMKKSFAQLPTLMDVDTEEDWKSISAYFRQNLVF